MLLVHHFLQQNCSRKLETSLKFLAIPRRTNWPVGAYLIELYSKSYRIFVLGWWDFLVDVVGFFVDVCGSFLKGVVAVLVWF